MKPLEKLIADLDQADTKDDAVFRSLLARSAQELSLLDKDIARELDASRPTVNRWRSGATSPHPLLRRHIFARLKRRAVALLKRALLPA